MIHVAAFTLHLRTISQLDATPNGQLFKTNEQMLFYLGFIMDYLIVTELG
jgi:hypothetical protein